MVPHPAIPWGLHNDIRKNLEISPPIIVIMYVCNSEDQSMCIPLTWGQQGLLSIDSSPYLCLLNKGRVVGWESEGSGEHGGNIHGTDTSLSSENEHSLVMIVNLISDALFSE